MKDMTDADDLAFRRFLCDWFKTGNLELERLDLVCYGKVYRLRLPDGDQLFVKRKCRDNKAVDFLRTVPPTDLMPRLRFRDDCRFGEESVFFFEWRKAKHVRLEDMSEGQFEEFLCRYRDLVPLLQVAKDVRPAKDADALMETVRGYVRRFPVRGRLLAPVASLAREAYVYPPGRAMTVSHGDFHFRNFGFTDGGRLMFFDFDNLVWGGPAEDLTFAVVHSLRRLGVSPFSARRRRLVARFGRMMRSMGWPAADWRIALGRIRLEAMATRIASHPDDGRTAFNLFKRDLNVRVLARAIDRYERE